MTRDPRLPEVDWHGSAQYRIRLAGRIDESWTDRLSGMRITAERPSVEGTTISVLSGSLADQAALSGVLSCVYNLGLVVLSIERTEIAVESG